MKLFFKNTFSYFAISILTDPIESAIWKQKVKQND